MRSRRSSSRCLLRLLRLALRLRRLPRLSGAPADPPRIRAARAILNTVDPASVQDGYQHLLEDVGDDATVDLAALAEVDAAHVTTSMLLVTRKMMEAMPKIKMIVRHGVGYDNVDLEAADDLGIAICNVPDYGTEEVTDMAFAHTLGLLRGTYNHAKNVREGIWNGMAGGRLKRIRAQQPQQLPCPPLFRGIRLLCRCLGRRLDGGADRVRAHGQGLHDPRPRLWDERAVL